MNDLKGTLLQMGCYLEDSSKTICVFERVKGLAKEMGYAVIDCGCPEVFVVPATMETVAGVEAAYVADFHIITVKEGYSDHILAHEMMHGLQGCERVKKDFNAYWVVVDGVTTLDPDKYEASLVEKEAFHIQDVYKRRWG